MSGQIKNGGPVDVLAVLDEFVVVVGDEFGNDPAVRLREARLAVAELIETLKCARDELSNLNSAYGAESVDQVVGRCDAALARAGGAK